MRWTTPTDDQYDERRALFNGMIDGRPRLIATCESPADVVAALSRATSDDLEIAVRSGVDFPMLIHRWAAGYPLSSNFNFASVAQTRLLLASAGHALRFRCFSLSGKEFANVIQFISRAASF